MAVKQSMKSSLLLTIVVAAGMCPVSCRPGNSADHGSAGPAYELGSPEFVRHTPSEFHQLKVGLAKEAVLEAVGNPNRASDLVPLGRMGKPPVGHRYTYFLNDKGGIVWVDFDTDMHVTGIFWRDRD
jgi:hypothetical protein